MPRVGDPAPPFRLPATGGGEIALEDLRGRKVVLYFYPKDNTPGCTREACDFRDHLPRFRRAGAVVLGVSSDSIASHERFRARHGLAFPLLSDPDRSVARAYGAYGPKTMYGRRVMGTIRSTFLVDEAGRIAAVWSPVRVDGHVEQVLAAVTGGPVAARPSRRRVAAPAKKKAAKKRATARPAPKKKKKK